MRYRLIRFAALLAAPWWYLRMRLEGSKAPPSDYFLHLLMERQGPCRQAIVFIFLLSIASRSFDAEMALKALRVLKNHGVPIPLWALSARDIGVLLEAPLWLGSTHEFEAVADDILHGSKPSSRVRLVLDFYQRFARSNRAMTDEMMVDGVKVKAVLPALFLERVAAKGLSDGRPQDALDALYEALRFVPENDPRRAELVERFRRIQADLRERP